MTQSRNVGFIGLGSMGSAMAPRLLENGHAVIAYDVNPSARAAFAAAGGLAGDSVEEVGNRADMVFTSLPSPRSSGKWRQSWRGRGSGSWSTCRPSVRAPLPRRRACWRSMAGRSPTRRSAAGAPGRWRAS
ncbi:NAD(P)-binding domain-containing protein [Sphingobium fuliginis]|uniref:NAD(P)-binding domain-containing protein n=1 Tax=Sphingobium fuliginis (strain ATCC 27551) TaxID=336203 RepID=UPI003137C52B